MGLEFSITDNTGAFKKALLEQRKKALETCGLLAEGYAVLKCPVDTGRLRNSITHQVDPDGTFMLVGTNMEYGKFVELGTGIYAEGGRQSAWRYQREDGSWVTTNGSRPAPYLVPALADHLEEYTDTIKDVLAE